MKDRDIQRVPISEIRVVNPRSRNKIAFRSIINNIGAIGLKKPITVSRCKPNQDGTCYELVCGQGRLEAVASLGGKEISAIVTNAPRRERYLMSLVENIARQRPRGSELLREVRRLKQAHYTNTAIAEMLGLGRSYVDGIVRLAKSGESELVQHVEAGTIPLSIAIKIATSGDSEIQKALNTAYQRGELRGAKLRTVERLLSTRLAAKRVDAQPRASLSGTELLKEFEAHTERQRAVVKRASIVHERLAVLAAAMKSLLGDARFVRLLKTEHLDTMPEQLLSRVKALEEATK